VSLRLPVGIVCVAARANGCFAQSRQMVVHHLLIGTLGPFHAGRGVARGLPIFLRQFMRQADTLIVGHETYLQASIWVRPFGFGSAPVAFGDDVTCVLDAWHTLGIY
jgi:hypothetical protein